MEELNTVGPDTDCAKQSFCPTLHAQRVASRPYAHSLENIGRWKHKAGLLRASSGEGRDGMHITSSPIICCCGCTLGEGERRHSIGPLEEHADGLINSSSSMIVYGAHRCTSCRRSGLPTARASSAPNIFSVAAEGCGDSSSSGGGDGGGRSASSPFDEKFPPFSKIVNSSRRPIRSRGGSDQHTSPGQSSRGDGSFAQDSISSSQAGESTGDAGESRSREALARSTTYATPSSSPLGSLDMTTTGSTVLGKGDVEPTPNARPPRRVGRAGSSDMLRGYWANDQESGSSSAISSTSMNHRHNSNNNNNNNSNNSNNIIKNINNNNNNKNNNSRLSLAVDNENQTGRRDPKSMFASFGQYSPILTHRHGSAGQGDDGVVSSCSAPCSTGEGLGSSPFPFLPASGSDTTAESPAASEEFFSGDPATLPQRDRVREDAASDDTPVAAASAASDGRPTKDFRSPGYPCITLPIIETAPLVLAGSSVDSDAMSAPDTVFRMAAITAVSSPLVHMVGSNGVSLSSPGSLPRRLPNAPERVHPVHFFGVTPLETTAANDRDRGSGSSGGSGRKNNTCLGLDCSTDDRGIVRENDFVIRRASPHCRGSGWYSDEDEALDGEWKWPPQGAEQRNVLHHADSGRGSEGAGWGGNDSFGESEEEEEEEVVHFGTCGEGRTPPLSPASRSHFYGGLDRRLVRRNWQQLRGGLRPTWKTFDEERGSGGGGGLPVTVAVATPPSACDFEGWASMWACLQSTTPCGKSGACGPYWRQ